MAGATVRVTDFAALPLPAVMVEVAKTFTADVVAVNMADVAPPGTVT